MGKWKKLACVLAFFALHFLMQAVIHVYAPSDSPAYGVKWTSAAVVQPDGVERLFDPASALPALEEGEWYRFSAQLPETLPDGVRLTFAPSDWEGAVFLDGQELWYAMPGTESPRSEQVRVSLPVRSGETLTLDLRPAGAGASQPAVPELSLLSTQDAGGMAFRFPVEAPARVLLLFWGLFLISVARRETDWLLLLPMAAVLCRIAWQIATGTGAGLLPPLVQSALSGLWMNILAALVMVLYLVLHRQRAFWRALGKAAAWSAGILALLLGTAALNQGRLYRLFLAPSIRQLQDGDLNILFYWVTLWLVFLAGGLAVMQLIRSLTRVQLEARTLALRNSLLMSGYRTLERKMRESAAIRHESAHRLAALDAMLQKGDLDKLAESLAVWRQASDAAAQPIFTPNLVVNAILQDAAGRAQESGIAFQAVAAVPEHLPFPDEDLCTLLMNLLDNALEGAERTPEGRRKAVSCKLALDGGILSVLCENTYDGHVSVDLDGALRTTKADSAFHGFGLPQMRAVVQKYKSALDLHYTDSTFTVQAALPVPKRAREAV